MSPIRRLALPESYELRATLAVLGMKAAGRAPLSEREAWRATRTPDGPATLHVTRNGSVADVRAWGGGADWALEKVPELLGLHDEPRSFEPVPGLVRELHRRRPGLHLGRTSRVFDTLFGAILGQRVTSREARSAYRRLTASHGTPAPGPSELVLSPDPETLADLPYYEYHRAGVERSRANVLIEAARRANRLEETLEMTKEDAWRRLQAVRGIGPWTAAMPMAIAWGDPDAVPVGDYHIPNLVSWALAGEPRGDDDRMLELLEPYAGQRWRALLLLKGSGIKAPKYGPRTATRSIEHI